jgi:hypothetical protein
VFLDGNKSLYLVFVGVIFFQHLELLLEQLGHHFKLLLEQLQQYLGCFLGQQLAPRIASSLASYTSI